MRKLNIIDRVSIYINKGKCRREECFCNNMKGITYVDGIGYRCLNTTGEYVHRWVARNYGTKNREKVYTKYPEVIHHIDGNKLNNHPENLWWCHNQFEHNKIHKQRVKL